ncbi:MAG: regulator of sigma D [Alteromonadaceae bacterium]|jgi:regulator of sigma D
MAGTNQTIDNWLQERQAVLVSYFELAGLPPFEQSNNTLPCILSIKRFCQILMGYISAGHFEQTLIRPLGNFFDFI